MPLLPAAAAAAAGSDEMVTLRCMRAAGNASAAGKGQVSNENITYMVQTRAVDPDSDKANTPHAWPNSATCHQNNGQRKLTRDTAR